MTELLQDPVFLSLASGVLIVLCAGVLPPPMDSAVSVGPVSDDARWAFNQSGAPYARRSAHGIPARMKA